LHLWFVSCACLTPFSLQAGAGLSFETNLRANRIRDSLSSPNVERCHFHHGSRHHIEWTPEAATGETISYFIGQDLLTNAGIQQLTFALAPLDPVSLQPGTPQYLRPGANLSGAVTSSDPKVLAITTPVVAVPPAGGPGPTAGKVK
jgi:hypothetical protein